MNSAGRQRGYRKAEATAKELRGAGQQQERLLSGSAAGPPCCYLCSGSCNTSAAAATQHTHRPYVHTLAHTFVHTTSHLQLQRALPERLVVRGPPACLAGQQLDGLSPELEPWHAGTVDVYYCLLERLQG